MPDPILPRRNGMGGREGAKQSFLAAMSHELRTPLNAVIGFAEIMDGQVLGPIEVPQYRQYVRDILESGRHLLRIIEGVLDISNAEAGELVHHRIRTAARDGQIEGRARGEGRAVHEEQHRQRRLARPRRGGALAEEVEPDGAFLSPVLLAPDGCLSGGLLRLCGAR